MIDSAGRNELIHAPEPASAAKSEYGIVGRSLYATSYCLSYGVVLPTLLVASVIPTRNAMGYGLHDGAVAAGQANRRVQTQVAATATATTHKLSDAYANVSARFARRLEAIEDAIAERRHRRRAATA